MKKDPQADETTVTFQDGKGNSISTTVEGLKSTVNELQVMNDIVEVSGDQLKHQLGLWKEKIYELYKKNGGEMKINLAVNLDADGSNCNVKTTISFSLGKISDELIGTVSSQPKLL